MSRTKRELTCGLQLISPELAHRLISGLTAEHNLNTARATEVVDQVLVFVLARAITVEHLAPSRLVALGLEIFVRYAAEDYRRFCAEYTGKFVPPGTTCPVGGVAAAFARTWAALPATGLPVLPDVWAHPAPGR